MSNCLHLFTTCKEPLFSFLRGRSLEATPFSNKSLTRAHIWSLLESWKVAQVWYLETVPWGQLWNFMDIYPPKPKHPKASHSRQVSHWLPSAERCHPPGENRKTGRRQERAERVWFREHFLCSSFWFGSLMVPSISKRCHCFIVFPGNIRSSRCPVSPVSSFTGSTSKFTLSPSLGSRWQSTALSNTGWPWAIGMAPRCAAAVTDSPVASWLGLRRYMAGSMKPKPAELKEVVFEEVWFIIYE